LEEVLPVVKADAVVDPGAVVVHVEGALAADAAVVGAVRLEGVAEQAVALALRVLVPDFEPLY